MKPQQIHCSNHLVRYQMLRINPKGTKSPFLLLQLIANHGVTFRVAATIPWVQLVQLSVGRWFIWSPHLSLSPRAIILHSNSLLYHSAYPTSSHLFISPRSASISRAVMVWSGRQTLCWLWDGILLQVTHQWQINVCFTEPKPISGKKCFFISLRNEEKKKNH